MKLLLDENLSDRIIRGVLDLYPDSTHVKFHDLIQSEDVLIWKFAKDHGFVIVSKDSDFHQRSLVFGHPPKLVYLRVGNCRTDHIAEILRLNHSVLSAFEADVNASILILP